MGLFVKGQSGNPSGRPKKLRIDVWNECLKKNFNPVLELIKLAQDPTTGRKTKAEILMDLCTYIAPKLRSVEVSQEEGKELAFNVILNATNSEQ